MPRGASPKREKEYKKLTKKFASSGRYGKRAKEVAARIVNKQRATKGETKGSKSRASSRTKSRTTTRSRSRTTTRAKSRR